MTQGKDEKSKPVLAGRIRFIHPLLIGRIDVDDHFAQVIELRLKASLDLFGDAVALKDAQSSVHHDVNLHVVQPAHASNFEIVIVKHPRYVPDASPDLVQ